MKVRVVVTLDIYLIIRVEDCSASSLGAARYFYHELKRAMHSTQAVIPTHLFLLQQRLAYPSPTIITPSAATAVCGLEARGWATCAHLGRLAWTHDMVAKKAGGPVGERSRRAPARPKQPLGIKIARLRRRSTTVVSAERSHFGNESTPVSLCSFGSGCPPAL